MTMQRGRSGSDAGDVPSSIGPACPQNWYLVARCAELSAGAILTRPLGAIEIVLYRGRDNGRAVAFAAHCAHAGCHLRHGTVVGDNLRCGLHHRIIAPDGQFIAKDGTALGARQLRLPLIERFGCIFVFAGAEATFDLPTPEICALGPVATRALAPQTFPLPWSTLTSNGMDIDHLQAVHDRELIEPAAFQHVDEHRVRLSYRARVTGSHLSDRMMRWLSNDEIRTSITCVAGSMMLVDSAVGRHRTFVILSMCPVGHAASSARAVAGVAGAPERASARLSVAVAAWLFRAFLEKDVGVLQRMNWREPDVEITAGDVSMRRLCRFFRSLPEFDPAAGPRIARAAAPTPAREGRFATPVGAVRARHMTQGI
jgi:aminopyrrolnitrin oxygenase